MALASSSKLSSVRIATLSDPGNVPNSAGFGFSGGASGSDKNFSRSGACMNYQLPLKIEYRFGRKEVGDNKCLKMFCTYSSSTIIVPRCLQVAKIFDRWIAFNRKRGAKCGMTRTVNSCQFNPWIVFECFSGCFEFWFRLFAMSAP